MKKGFTLVELLVVIAIIGILSAIVIGTIGGGTETARATKCRSNMRSLAQACISRAMADGRKRYPHAGSCEYWDMVGGAEVFGEHRGWLSWMSKNKYRGGLVGSHQSCRNAGVFSSRDDVMFAYTNGAIWSAVGCNSSVFKCPTLCLDHRNPSDKTEMGWSYAMSAYFRYDSTFGEKAIEGPNTGRRLDEIKHPDKTLMFAEINFDDVNGGNTGDYTADCVLEYGKSNSGHREQIGFPHKVKRGYVGNVAFADAHVDQFMKPKFGDARDLTQWLCEGKDVTYANGQYQENSSSVGE